uniref:EGF-like domain-containing protein n=1 Tax=Eucampia antarctica TaxID=49252 RepID=A0A7S2S8K4_9STRA|mmetsp:Transcript_4587/g.4348  ORF Transcript_4587/g.4348 Transcript_4587/m.4348 type:complete len:106 (+) Transcript_4587:90-407(+)
MVYGCVCDSSWSVGLGAGNRQEPEWFGADCSLRHCPSGDDPRTSLDETDCGGKMAKGGFGTGETGNFCHVDCSNRGICDYNTGRCQCFDGHYGEACNLQSVLAQY